MGNRNAGARRKARDSAYTYSDHRREDFAANKNGGSISRRQPQAQLTDYYPHSNGHAGSTMSQTTISSYKTNSNKIIYVANYDFNGTSSTGELSFRKGDRLEILDRYS